MVRQDTKRMVLTREMALGTVKRSKVLKREDGNEPLRAGGAPPWELGEQRPHI